MKNFLRFLIDTLLACIAVVVVVAQEKSIVSGATVLGLTAMATGGAFGGALLGELIGIITMKDKFKTLIFFGSVGVAAVLALILSLCLQAYGNGVTDYLVYYCRRRLEMDVVNMAVDDMARVR